MDRDFERRFFTTLVLVLIFWLYMMWLPSLSKKRASADLPVPGATTNVVAEAVPLDVKTENLPFTNILLRTKEVSLEMTSDGGIASLAIDGAWNQSGGPVSLLRPAKSYGALQWDKEGASSAAFRLMEAGDTFAQWQAFLVWNGTPLEVRLRYEVTSNYTLMQHIMISNRSREATKIDYQGRSFLLRWRPDIVDTNTAGTGDLQTYGAYIEKKFVPLLKRGFLGSAQNAAFVSNFQWVALADNYFVFSVEPMTPGVTAALEVESRYKTVEQTAITLYLPTLFLASGEATNFSLRYYCGPRKENLLRAIHSSYGQLFRWPVVFAWFMKPIEWAMVWLLSLLGGWIPNKGIVIILIALIVKILLSPLSIQAAVSVKKQQLLQPKIKNIQDKYKDDQRLLQQKIMELYKKEKINPLGGCLPLLLQIPVFFALYRVLSQSVELRGATFLWVKDLTQPDTLFTLTIPFLPHHFNLLPLIMTAIQLIQTKLQTAKNPAMKGQELNMYLLPVVFLFLFWNMPSGLVLYWTIQNIYTIIEQEIINLDRHVRV